MGMKEILEKIRNKREFVKDMELKANAERRLINKQKNSNERELEQFMEEARQEAIKKQLNKFRNDRTKAAWADNRILNTPNVFKGERNMLKTPFVFGESHQILKQRNVFMK